MRIALVSANRERLPDPVVPIGLLYVAAALPAEHTVELWDLCFEEDPFAYLAEGISRFEPELIAIGLRNIQSGDYSGPTNNVTYYRGLMAELRAVTRAPIVLGGGGFSVMPRELMTYLKPDYGISGEGEAPFRALVAALESGGDGLAEIGNLHYFRDDELVSVAAGPFIDLNTLAPPERRLADARYFVDCGTDSVQTKRGCPLRCDYCTYPLIEGRTIRQRDPATVVDEMFTALDAQPTINHFFVVDSVFNLPPSHAKAVCREMIRRGLRTPWTSYANPIGFDRELADLMAEAHCTGMEVGSDSGVDAVLDRLKKGFHVDQIVRLHEHAVAAGVLDCHTFILGTTGETLDDVCRTLDFCTELDPAAAVFMIWTDDYEALDTELAAERRAFRAQILALMQEKAEQCPRWVIPALAKNYDERLFRALRRRGLEGPLWQHIQKFRPSRRPVPQSADRRIS